MSKRVLTCAALATSVLLMAGAPASAQTYPPPVRSITVDDTTPTPGQSVVVSLRTCRPRTTALLGIGLSLVGAPTVGSDGLARATVTVPTRLRPGRYVVSGACLTPALTPLFLTTVITVVAPTAGGSTGGGGTGGGGTGTAPPAGGPSAAAPSAAGAGGGAGPAAATTGTPTGAGGSAAGGVTSSMAALDSPTVADAPSLFEDLATANGVTEGDDARATASVTDAATPASDPGPGTLSTIARVALGVAALGGVPVALAVSRRPARTVRRGFA